MARPSAISTGGCDRRRDFPQGICQVLLAWQRTAGTPCTICSLHQALVQSRGHIPCGLGARQTIPWRICLRNHAGRRAQCRGMLSPCCSCGVLWQGVWKRSAWCGCARVCRGTVLQRCGCLPQLRSLPCQWACCCHQDLA